MVRKKKKNVSGGGGQGKHTLQYWLFASGNTRRIRGRWNRAAMERKWRKRVVPGRGGGDKTAVFLPRNKSLKDKCEIEKGEVHIEKLKGGVSRHRDGKIKSWGREKK